SRFALARAKRGPMLVHGARGDGSMRSRGPSPFVASALAFGALAWACCHRAREPETAAEIAPAKAPAEWIWGVTADDVTHLPELVDALHALPRRPTTRIVFDEGVAAATYREPVTAIHGVSGVMGEILDSMFVDRVDVAGYRNRAIEYFDTLGDSVDIW